jgi:hypothetical protein
MASPVTRDCDPSVVGQEPVAEQRQVHLVLVDNDD